MALLSFNSICCLSTSPDLQKWNNIIKAQVLEGNAGQAIRSYVKMQRLGLFADNYTFPVLLKAAGNASYLGIGLALHGQILKTGFCDHLFVQTALLKMYSSLGIVAAARKAFDKMPVKDVVAWNSMLYAYASSGQTGNAVQVFDTMPSQDLLSFNIMISGFAGTGSNISARSIFDRIPDKDIVSWNSMILACMNAGDVAEARELFESMPEKNVITWNTMIMGYLNNQVYSKAIEFLDKMKMGNIEPDHLSVTAALSACAHLGSLETGIKIHTYAKLSGQASSPHVATALIDMYAKCGSIHNSLEVFYKFKQKDVYCWNAIISGLALHGFGHAALKIFNQMRADCRVKPDDITFIGVLSACSHGGLVEQGCELFDSMEKQFGITPKAEHYGCMVDLLSRAGLFDSALTLIETMPFEASESILGALLSACVIHQDLENGEKAMKLIVSTKAARSDGEYMMFANLYASCGEWEEAQRWRDMMNESGIEKTAGCSLVEINGRFHKFMAGDENGIVY
ncbi:putative tetratricopeptide-like helical domain-containing protein [Rosa chinensis]|uniref:Putative tetratricopeptide-like helical domain-containing protein n=1 Tax=Rosa chinensis TaxID=74649 RepID=A0A2P6PY93_ROSCH|nr:pentatricopeptide repeat-containing protein At3g29230 [Rosa chinensis]PRQ26876.1 putative tetratricopeptide-like helical domain-containing protein [Rosa chinensis]